MRNITGAVAEGDDFFNRSNEMAVFWRDLETDNTPPCSHLGASEKRR